MDQNLQQQAEAAVFRRLLAHLDERKDVAELKTLTAKDRRATVEVISDRVERAMQPWRLATMLFVALGLVALTLACVGVYSVMSYITAERIPELGIRLVLGATNAELVALVLRGGMKLIGAGILLGLGSAAFGAPGAIAEAPCRSSTLTPMFRCRASSPPRNACA